MKKRYFLPIIPTLLTIISGVYPVGWPMPSETIQAVARVVFWVSLCAIPAVSLIAYWDKINNWIPIMRFESRRKERRIEDLIYRQIIRVSASPLVSGSSECLDVSVILPTFITKKLELAKVRGYLTIDGHPTDEQELGPIILFDRNPNENQLRISLTAPMSALVQERIKNNTQVEIALHLTGWDVKNTRYDLSTRGWTTKFLT